MLDLRKRMPLDFLAYTVNNNSNPLDVPKGETWYRYPFGVHKNIGVLNKTYVCLNPTSPFETKCPICNQLAPLWQNKIANKEILDNNKRKARDLFFVIDRDEDGDKVRLLDISFHMFTKQLLIEIGEGNERLGDFFEFKEGITLNTRWEQKTYNKGEYFEISRIDFETESREDYSEDIMPAEYDPEKMLIKLPAEQLEKIFLEVDDVSSGGEEKEEKTSSRKEKEKGPEKKKKKEEELEEELEEEEKPKGRSRDGKEEKNKCPEGYKFGTDDCDTKPKCADCPQDLWNECMNAAGK